MKFIIGTGYFQRTDASAEEFFKVWWKNTKKYYPDAIIHVVANGGYEVSAKTSMDYPANWTVTKGDVGHIHHVNSGDWPYHFCGYTITLLTLCLIAYAEEADLIFKEQDCLAFGKYAEKMDEEIGDGSIIYGTGVTMPCFQSLMLIRHSFLPQFVQWYLQCGSEQIKANEGEQKFARMEKEHPKEFRRFSFGYDRDRPYNAFDPVFYIQQVTQEEQADLREKGLLEIDNTVEATKV